MKLINKNSFNMIDDLAALGLYDVVSVEEIKIRFENKKLVFNEGKLIQINFLGVFISVSIVSVCKYTIYCNLLCV